MIASCRRWSRLAPGDRDLRRRAFVLLAAARAGASLLPLPSLRRRLRALAGRGRRDATPGEIARAVESAALRVPGARCLARALAAEALLLRHGLPAALRIGVAKPGASSLEAHAWVLSGGEVVAGDGDLGRYAAVELATR